MGYIDLIEKIKDIDADNIDYNDAKKCKEAIIILQNTVQSLINLLLEANEKINNLEKELAQLKKYCPKPDIKSNNNLIPMYLEINHFNDIINKIEENKNKEIIQSYYSRENDISDYKLKNDIYQKAIEK